MFSTLLPRAGGSRATYHDLALMQLATPVTLRAAVSPVCLPWDRGMGAGEGEELVVTGWGRTEYGEFLGAERVGAGQGGAWRHST